MKKLRTNFHLTSAILFALISVITSSVVFATGELLKLPSKLGVERIDISKTFKIDGKNYQFTFLDGMLIDEGVRKVTIDDKDYKIEVKTLPDKENIEITTSPYVYMFNKEAKIFNPVNRSLKPLSVSNDVKLTDSPQIAIFQDEFGNVLDAVFIFPLLEKLDILDSQLPITNVTGRKFLLSSKSPYRILSKVLLTDKTGLILEEGVTIINALNSELTIKGTFITTGPVSISGSGTLNVSNSGSLYLKGNAFNTNITSDRGALVFLDGTKVNDVNLSMTNFVILRNADIKKASINGVYALYIINSTIENLNIQNCGTVILSGSNVVASSVSTLSRVIAQNSYFDNLQVSDLSEVNIVNTNVNVANVSRGSILKSKNSQINSLSVEDYSISYAFKTRINQLKHTNAKYYLLESKAGKIISQ